MSSLIVEVCSIDQVYEHPNADKLDLAKIKGWQVVIGKGTYKPGDKVVYFPPDCVLPEYVTDQMGVTKYCKPGYPKNLDGTRDPGSRVSVAKLRGHASYGLISRLPEDKDWEVGTDVAKYYGATKWEPGESKFKIFQGDMEREHPAFTRYTNIENVKNFPDAFSHNPNVVITEKIHGTNARLGLIKPEGEELFVAGSHKTQRKEPKEGESSLYWEPLTEPIKCMLRDLLEEWNAQVVIVFGEIFGRGVQDLCYGQEGHSFRVFDIMIDGKYMNYATTVNACMKFDVEMVPVLYEGPFELADIERLSTGVSTFHALTEENPKEFQQLEGIVIKPTIEQHSDILNGRLILKSINPDYLVRKGGTENH